MMAIAMPNYLMLFIILTCTSIISLASPFTNNWIQIPSQVQIEAKNEDRQFQTFNVTIQNITVSNGYFWGIDDRASNRFPPGNLVMCARPCTDGDWIDGKGALDHIDANSRAIWGTNPSIFRYLYSKPIYASNTVDFTRFRNFEGCGCSCDVTVSNNGYVWVLSCVTTIMCNAGGDCLTIPHRISNNLIQIETDNEEVWAVDDRYHIFKRPVNGSGEWSSVPGEMRYISASGNAHVWGIAPNNSLYMCEKPCSGDWQYVGGSFKQIDGGNDIVIGVTTSNTLIAMSLQGMRGI